MLIYDNGHKRVVEIDGAGRIVWEFPLNDTTVMGDADLLSNGNILTLNTMGAEILEVTPQKKIVWRLRSPYAVNLFKAERVGYVVPKILVNSPINQTYYSKTINLNFSYSNTDLSTIWYRIYDNTRNRWVTGNVTYLHNDWTNKLTLNGTILGDKTISLDYGKYTLYVWSNSTGWGDENLYLPKMANVESVNIDFSIGDIGLIGGPGWTDDTVVFVTIAAITIGSVYWYTRRKKIKSLSGLHQIF